jgi:Paf1 complex subunit CDC73 N-terminal
MDALSVLRQTTVSGQSISYESPYYLCGGQRLLETDKTCFRRTLSNRDGGFYTVRDVVFFLTNGDNEGEYRKRCITDNVMAVVVQDKQAMRDYLTGVTTTCDQLEGGDLAAHAIARHADTDAATPGKRPAVSLIASVSDGPLLKTARTEDKPYATSDSVLLRPGAVRH